MMKRYWAFVIENTQLYRLMNGMDGALIDVTDLLQAARQNVERDPDVALPVYLTVLVAYFAVNYPVSLASRRLEKRLA